MNWSWRSWSNLIFLPLIVMLTSTGCMEINLAVSGGKPHAPSPKLGNVKVSRHVSVSLTKEEVKYILDEATKIANTNDGQGDVDCQIKFELDGEVGQFDFAVIRGKNDLDSLNKNHQGVKVVEEIQWCDQLWPDILGCQKGSGIVVVRAHPEEEGVLWLHEFGHLKNIDHRNQTNAVMNKVIRPSNKLLNSNECSRYSQAGQDQ